jgi:biotin carboxyl carrier protein
MPEPLTREPKNPLPSQELPRLLEELGLLLATPAAPAMFFAEFLKRVVYATGVAGGAIWTRSAEEAFELEHGINWPALRLEAAPDGSACHAQILEVASQRERALWVPPHSGSKLVGEHGHAANRSDHGLLIAPVIVDRQVIGHLEVWLKPVPDGTERRELARLLTELTGFLAAYHHKRQCQTLIHQQDLWLQLDTFVRQIHGSLDPQIVAQLIAQEGRRLLGCDQVAVALTWGAKTKVAAVSGAAIVESNSRLVQCLRTLCDGVVRWGETLTFQGQRDETLPPAVVAALDAYLTESNCKMLIVLPLRKVQNGAADGPAFAALTAESFEPASSVEQVQHRLQALAPHASSALGNAVEMSRLPLHRFARVLARVRDWANTRTVTRLGLYALPLVLLGAVLTLVPMSLRLEAKGQLLPVQRQMVYATQNGKIVELRARPGDRVEKGQELLFIEDLDTQLQIDQLAIKIGAAEQRLALLSEQLGKKTSNQERSGLVKERIQQQYELRKATVERDILLQTSRSPRKAPVFAPFTGKVVTFDAHEQLLGKTVKPGDALVRIACVKGVWEIELQIPERNVGPIREGLFASEVGYVDVDLLLTSQPHRTYRGRLYKDGLGGETRVVDNAVVLPARVRIVDDDLIQQMENLPVGLEVRSKVHCGPRSIGAVWFHEVWEFFYEHVIFLLRCRP